MENIEYNRLLKILKCPDKDHLYFPKDGKQEIYKIHSILNSNENFRSYVSRTHHKKRKKLSLIMISNKYGSMMRFDIIGCPHKDIPTPHLHIFNKGNAFSKQTCLSYNQLPKEIKPDLNHLDRIDDLIDNFKNFLEYNNVDLKDVVISTLIC